MYFRFYQRLALIFVAVVSSPGRSAPISPLYQPLPGLGANDLAIIVNDADPLSVQIGNYYQHKRNIPKAQVIHIRFKAHIDAMPQELFATLKAQVDKQTPEHIQAYALTWIKPYRVDCMSITTAFALGFDPAYCATGCIETRKSPYFASNSQRPFQEFKLRPTMVVATDNLDSTKQLIDRGVSADYTHPSGTGYLLKTSDVARSSRAAFF